MSIDAYAKSEDFDKFKPKTLTKKVCVTEGDVKTIKKRAEEEAKLEALTDYDPMLINYSAERILPLLREVKYSEGAFVPGTATYCVEVSGIVYPFEFMALSKEVESEVKEEQFTNGLYGMYFNLPPFNNKNFPQLPEIPVYERIDKSIDFSWKEGIPGENISADYFGVLWVGKLYTSVEGTYQFLISRDDYAVLEINQQRVTMSRAENSKVGGDKYLAGDKWHSIKMIYYEITDNAYVRLYWRRPGKSDWEIIPTTNLNTNKELAYSLREKSRGEKAK